MVSDGFIILIVSINAILLRIKVKKYPEDTAKMHKQAYVHLCILNRYRYLLHDPVAGVNFPIVIQNEPAHLVLRQPMLTHIGPERDVEVVFRDVGVI